MIQHIVTHTNQIVSARSIKIKNENDNIYILLDIKIKAGSRNFTELSRLIQKKIKKGLEYFTGLTVKKVDIIVSEAVI